MGRRNSRCTHDFAVPVQALPQQAAGSERQYEPPTYACSSENEEKSEFLLLLHTLTSTPLSTSRFSSFRLDSVMNIGFSTTLPSFISFF